MVVDDNGNIVIPEMIIKELEKITRNGANKYGANPWLHPNGLGSTKRNNYKSILGHVSDAYANIKEDHESGLDPRLHAVWRLLADFYRDKKGIVGDTE